MFIKCIDSTTRLRLLDQESSYWQSQFIEKFKELIRLKIESDHRLDQTIERSRLQKIQGNI